jgi:hypothetical protein
VAFATIVLAAIEAIPPTGSPVAFVSVPLAGVPSAPPTKYAAPVPTSSVSAARRFALDGVARNVATPVPRPVTLPTAGVQVVAEAAVVRPLPLTVSVGHCVAEPKEPTLELTVASVTTPAASTAASPDSVRQIGSAPDWPTASCAEVQSSEV